MSDNTKADKLRALAAQVEKGEIGRELDAEIAVATFPSKATDDDLVYAGFGGFRFPVCEPGTYWHCQRSGRSLCAAPRFSTSIDAAMTLAVEGWLMEIYVHPTYCTVFITYPDSGQPRDRTEADSHAPTVAAAITAAWLRVRALIAEGK